MVDKTQGDFIREAALLREQYERQVQEANRQRDAEAAVAAQREADKMTQILQNQRANKRP